MYTAAYMWAKVVGQLEKQLTETVVSACLDDVEVMEVTPERVAVFTPSPLRRNILRSQYARYITDAFRELFDMNIRLEVWGEEEIAAQKKETRAVAINPQYTFETFVEGSSNRFAKHVTMMAAQNPGQEICNPLFLHGVPGVGKTHLLYAVANHILQTKPELKVVCLKAEEFTNELVGAIRLGNTAEFRNKYRQADVLLLDDIQFIAGKEATQEEFYYTFNAMFESNRQIIMTADRKPSDMATLADRLRDRFGEGIMVEINAPDPQTRLQIAHVKAEKYGLKLDRETAEYISGEALNIRQIEGILKKIHAYRELTGMPLTLGNVRGIVEDLLAKQGAVQVTKEQILYQVCGYFGVEEELLKSPQRSRKATQPRQVAMYLMRKQAKAGLDEIAKCFRRDRATVMHSIKKVEEALEKKDTEMTSALENIGSNIEGCMQT